MNALLPSGGGGTTALRFRIASACRLCFSLCLYLGFSLNVRFLGPSAGAFWASFSSSQTVMREPLGALAGCRGAEKACRCHCTPVIASRATRGASRPVRPDMGFTASMPRRDK